MHLWRRKDDEIDSYGLDVEDDATFVLLPAETPADAVASRPARRLVYRKDLMALGGSCEALV